MAAPAVVSRFAFCRFARPGFNPFENQFFSAANIARPLIWDLIFLKVWDTDRFGTFVKVLFTAAGCALTVTSDRSCAAPLAVPMMGRSRNGFREADAPAHGHNHAVRRRILVFNQTYGMVRTACRFAVPLLFLDNGRFFCRYYPAHVGLTGLIIRVFPS